MSRLSHGAARDLRWFTIREQEPGVGRALWPSTLGTLTNDASPYGCGGHWQDLLPAAGLFTAAQRDLRINVKEVAAVRFCLLAFGSQLLGEEGLLQLRVDSRVAMHVINGFSSRSPVLMAELRKLHEVALLYRVALRASWLPSVANVWADTLSRQGDRDDWRLSNEMFARLQLRYGCHAVDRLATPLNALCPRFNTKMHAPGTEAVDAFSVSWGGENNWVNPPFSQAARVLDKVSADKATATVVLPVWVAQAWWAPAVASANEAYLLPRSSGLFTSGRSHRPAPPPRWRFAVLRFVHGGRSPSTRAKAAEAARRADYRRVRHGAGRRRQGGAATKVGHWRVPAPSAALTLLPPASSGTTA